MGRGLKGTREGTGGVDGLGLDRGWDISGEGVGFVELGAEFAFAVLGSCKLCSEPLVLCCGLVVGGLRRRLG